MSQMVPQFISTHGKIVGPGPGKTVMAALPNGKEVVAFASHALEDAGGECGLTAGMEVEMELTPFDFSKARITAIKNPLPSS